MNSNASFSKRANSYSESFHGGRRNRVFCRRLCSLESLLRCQAVSCRKHPIPKIRYELHHLVTWPRVARSSGKFSAERSLARTSRVLVVSRIPLVEVAHPFSFGHCFRIFTKRKRKRNTVARVLESNVSKYIAARPASKNGVRNETRPGRRDGCTSCEQVEKRTSNREKKKEKKIKRTESDRTENVFVEYLNVSIPSSTF